MTPKQRAFADTLSLPDLLATHARVHEIHMATFNGIARNMRRDVDLSRIHLLHEALERAEGELLKGIPELINGLHYIISRVRNELGGNAPAAGGEQG